MQRELIAAALAIAAVAAHADCRVVFGQGRNLRQLGGPDWDDINQRFNTAVVDALDGHDQQHAYPLTMASAQTDVQAIGRTLLKQADQQGCRTLVETAVFTDDQGTLVLRLRAYPLLPEIGDGGAVVGLRFGTPSFVTQRELPPAAVLRMKTEELAAHMAAEYLQRDAR